MFIGKTSFYRTPVACDALQVTRRQRSKNCYRVDGQNCLPSGCMTYVEHFGMINMAKGTEVKVVEATKGDAEAIQMIDRKIKELEANLEAAREEKREFLDLAYARGWRLTSEEIIAKAN